MYIPIELFWKCYLVVIMPPLFIFYLSDEVRADLFFNIKFSIEWTAHLSSEVLIFWKNRMFDTFEYYGNVGHLLVALLNISLFGFAFVVFHDEAK